MDGGQSCRERGIDMKVTERLEGWEDVERLIVIRKMMCRKLREARKRSG